jgi:hypothetical protein
MPASRTKTMPAEARTPTPPRIIELIANSKGALSKRLEEETSRRAGFAGRGAGKTGSAAGDGNGGGKIGSAAGAKAEESGGGLSGGGAEGTSIILLHFGHWAFWPALSSGSCNDSRQWAHVKIIILMVSNVFK